MFLVNIICITLISGAILAAFTEGTIGVQVLSGGNLEAIAIAAATDLDLVRIESFVFGHIGDEGYTESNAAETLRFRKQIGAENVRILTDIEVGKLERPLLWKRRFENGILKILFKTFLKTGF